MLGVLIAQTHMAVGRWYSTPRITPFDEQSLQCQIEVGDVFQLAGLQK